MISIHIDIEFHNPNFVPIRSIKTPCEILVKFLRDNLSAVRIIGKILMLLLSCDEFITRASLHDTAVQVHFLFKTNYSVR